MTSDRRRSFRCRAAVAWLLLALVGAFASAGSAFAAPADAPSAPDKVPVLILDAGLGDSFYLTSHWLGDEREVASSGALRLLTSPAPVWWGGAGSPDTYVLTASDTSGSVAAAPLRSEEISWALDRLAERHREGKAVLLAQGAAGLQARSYLEDLGAVKQSQRADVVGLVLLGTPNGGLELASKYPNLDVWAPMAAGAGLSPADLLPGSPWLASLNAGKTPAVVHTLVVQGSAVELAGAKSDGLTVLDSSALATSVALGPINSLRVHASATQGWPLSRSWFAVTKKGGQSSDPVDERQVALLQSATSYVMSQDVAAAVKKYYESAFASGAPTTHISTRLVVDVSGSMADEFGSGTKLTAAKRAATDFTESLAARQALTGAVPEDIGLLAFSEQATVVAPGGTTPSDVVSKIAGLKIGGKTDVGKALSGAVDSLANSPRSADRVVVFLSDGVDTAGLNEKGILSGPVKKAADSGIRIETIALGGVASSDSGFLKQIASATGGSFHKANNLFELRRDFLRARYASIGDLIVDSGFETASTSQVDLGKVDPSVQLLEVAAVADAGSPTWQITRDGKTVPVEELSLNTSADGVTSLALVRPKPGTYALVLAGGSGAKKAHIFAVKQVEAFEMKTVAAPPDNTAMMVLIGLGAVAGVAVVGTVVASTGARRKKRTGTADEEDTGSGSPTDDGGQ